MSDLPNSKAKLIGKALIKAIIEHALKNVPIYGMFFSIGLDTAKNIEEQLEKEQQNRITVEQLIEALHALSDTERADIIDGILSSREGSKVISLLSPEQKQQLRENYIRLPAEFEKVLLFRQLEEQRIKAKEIVDNTNKQRMEKLASLLDQATKLGDVRSSLYIIKRMRTISNIDAPIVLTEKYLFDRLFKEDKSNIFIFLLIYLFIAFWPYNILMAVMFDHSDSGYVLYTDALLFYPIAAILFLLITIALSWNFFPIRVKHLFIFGTDFTSKSKVDQI